MPQQGNKKGKIAVREERQKWEHMVVLYLISTTGYSLALGYGRHLQRDPVELLPLL